MQFQQKFAFLSLILLKLCALGCRQTPLKGLFQIMNLTVIIGDNVSVKGVDFYKTEHDAISDNLRKHVHIEGGIDTICFDFDTRQLTSVFSMLSQVDLTQVVERTVPH